MKFGTAILSSGRFAIFGKNADQNEVLMNYVINRKDMKDRVIMHTEKKGSPFLIITNIVCSNKK